MADMFGKLYVRSIRLSDMPPARNYISTLPVVRNLAQMGELRFDKPVTIFVGENGVGKSTLIEALAVAMGFNAEGGTRNFRFSTENTHSELYQYLTVVKGMKYPKDGFFLRAESFYNVATNIDQMDSAPSFGPPIIDSYGGVSLHEQSHGESFMALVENRFGGNGVYILDEPEAALSPMRVMTLMARINELVKKNSQFIISTHSPMLAVAMGFNAEGGTRNFRFSTENTHSELYQYLTVVKGMKYPKDGFFLRAESFYNVATNIDQMDSAPSFGPPIIDSYGGVSLHEQSHGESFMALVENRFGGNGVYILDEPEAALSPMRVMTLMARINELVKKNSQFIISTHSPMLMTLPGAEIYEISGGGIKSVSYEETEHFQVMRNFLNAPERSLKYLLEE